jgi:hypothetical protein
MVNETYALIKITRIIISLFFRMKKIYFLVLSLVLTANFSFAQWTTSGNNIYYNTGSVGIGATTPLDKLYIAGTSSIPVRVVFGAGSGSIFYQTTIVDSLDAAGAISFQAGIGGAAK